MNLAQGYLHAFLRQFRSSLFSLLSLSLSLSGIEERQRFFHIDSSSIDTIIAGFSTRVSTPPLNSTTRGVERINLSLLQKRRGPGAR